MSIANVSHPLETQQYQELSKDGGDPTEMSLELVSGFKDVCVTIGWQRQPPLELDVFRFGVTMGFASLKLESRVDMS